MFTLRAKKTKNSTIFMRKINGIYIFLRKGYIYIPEEKIIHLRERKYFVIVCIFLKSLIDISRHTFEPR